LGNTDDNVRPDQRAQATGCNAERPAQRAGGRCAHVECSGLHIGSTDLLAYAYRRADGLFVNEAIVAGGYARPLTITPNDAYAHRFVAAATAAEAAGLGLWAACAESAAVGNDQPGSSDASAVEVVTARWSRGAPDWCAMVTEPLRRRRWERQPREASMGAARIAETEVVRDERASESPV